MLEHYVGKDHSEDGPLTVVVCPLVGDTERVSRQHILVHLVEHVLEVANLRRSRRHIRFRLC